MTGQNLYAMVPIYLGRRIKTVIGVTPCTVLWLSDAVSCKNDVGVSPVGGKNMFKTFMINPATAQPYLGEQQDDKNNEETAFGHNRRFIRRRDRL